MSNKPEELQNLLFALEEKKRGGAPLTKMDEHKPKFTVAYMAPFNAWVGVGQHGVFDLNYKLTRFTAKKMLVQAGLDARDADDWLKGDALYTLNGVGAKLETYPVITGPDGKLLANTWVPTSVQRQAGDWSTIKAMVETVCNFDSDAVYWLLNWMASKVQNPLSPSRGAVVCHGGQGAGKTQLGIFMRELIGRANSAVISAEALESNHNSQYSGKLFIVANEVVGASTSRHYQGRLKSFISDSDVMINPKGIAAYSVENRASWWFTSNELNPVVIEGDFDRHYLGVFHQPKAAEQMPEYLAKVRLLFRPDGNLSEIGQKELAAFHDVMLTWQVDISAARTPCRNEARNEMVHMSKDSVAQFIDCVELGGVDKWVSQITAREMNKGTVYQEGDWFFKMPDGQVAISSGGLYKCYVEYCREFGYMPMGHNKCTALIKRYSDTTPVRTKHYRGYLNITRSTQLWEDLSPRNRN